MLALFRLLSAHLPPDLHLGYRVAASPLIHSDPKVLLPKMPRRYLYRGRDPRDPAALTETELAERHRLWGDVRERIRQLNDQGVPLFSKAVFRHILDQLEYCRANPQPPNSVRRPVISLPTIDGHTAVDVELETGQVQRPFGDAEPRVYCTNMLPFSVQPSLSRSLPTNDAGRGDPYLDYWPLRPGETSRDIGGFSPGLADCSTRLIYPLNMHRIPDGVLLHDVDDRFVELPPVDADSTRQDFNSGVQAWRQTEECKRIESLLETEALPANITKIVAFALGDIARARSAQARHICQHALVLCVRDALERRQGPGQPAIQCFAQEPAYSDVDGKVLGEAGITVLRDPRGFLEVDDQTVVISIAPNIPVRQVVADIARPAVLMWDFVNDPPRDT